MTDSFSDLYFYVQRSIRYHQMRRRFFERSDYVVRSVAALSALGAFVTLLGSISDGLPLLFAGLAAAAMAFDLVVGFGRKAWTHRDLARCFREIEAEMTGQEAADEEQCVGWRKRILAIEEREPPHLRVLNALAYNQVARARGFKTFERVGPVQRFFAQLVDFRPDAVEHVVPEEEPKTDPPAALPPMATTG